MSSKLREALAKTRELLVIAQDPQVSQDMILEARKFISKALAEPLRNYEVGTPEEQEKRLLSEVESGKVELKGTIAEIIFKWSQMLYKKEGEE